MNSRADTMGLVVASYGNRGKLVAEDNTPRRFVLKGRKLRAVCGDTVSFQHQGDGEELLVTGVDERRNQLERPDARGKGEVLAANLDRVIVVLAPEPEPDLFIADRYLCAAERMGAAAAVVWNKADLSDTTALLDEYGGLGYPIICTSAVSGAGINALGDIMHTGTNMLVGLSGVGKSSLLNQLIPDAAAATGELSDASGEGRHTTTASVMFDLPAGGRLIDTPGVREFAPLIDDPVTVQEGFREIRTLADECRFADCMHLREPDCAVKRAVEEGAISERRYESYRRLVNTTRQLRRDFGPG